VHAGVVELDPLADAVRAGAQDDDLATVARRHLGLLLVARVVVRRERRELTGTGVNRLEDGAHPGVVAGIPHLLLGEAPQLGDLLVAEAVLLGVPQYGGVERGRSRD